MTKTPSCKICGTRFLVVPATQTSAVTVIQAMCDCGEIRKRLRKQGCPYCEKETRIQITKAKEGFEAFCPECMESWKVVENE